MVDFPNELLLQIFPHLCLKGLIVAHVRASYLWRHLVNIPDIDPTRRELWSLYRSFVRSEAFLESRPWTLEHLRPFNRQAYLDALVEQHDHLPHYFRLYILEWPAKAVIGCLWPGLMQLYFDSFDGVDDIELPRGCNLLSCLPPSVLNRPDNESLPSAQNFLPPLVHIVTYMGFDASGARYSREVPALLVWQEYQMVWLVLDGSIDFEGQVWQLFGQTYFEDDEEVPGVFGSWLDLLQASVEAIEFYVVRNGEGPESYGSGHMQQEIDGEPVSSDEWFRSLRRADKLWAEKHRTGRQNSGAVSLN